MTFAATLAERFQLSAVEAQILGTQVHALDRRSRKLYHARVEPRLRDFAVYFHGQLRADPAGDLASRWATQIAANIAARGYACIAEQVAMEVVGRARVAEVVRALKGDPAAPLALEARGAARPR